MKKIAIILILFGALKSFGQGNSITVIVGGGSVSGNLQKSDSTDVITGYSTNYQRILNTTAIATKQTGLNGTGYVKFTGSTPSYDNSTFATTTTSQALSGKSFTDSLFINPPNGVGSNLVFYMGPRANVALAFTVPVFRPSTANTVLALDLMPNGASVVENANGFTWFDVCSADLILNPLARTNAARAAIKSTSAEFSSRLFNFSSAVPLYLVMQNASGTTNALAIDTLSRVGIGTVTPAITSALDITSTTRGFLPPRMTSTQGSAISSPPDGLMIYVTDTNGTFTSVGFWGRVSGAWGKLNN